MKNKLNKKEPFLENGNVILNGLLLDFYKEIVQSYHKQKANKKDGQ